MTTKELSHVTRTQHLMDAGSQTATFTSAAVDTQGWEAVEFIWDMGVWVSGTFQLSLTECATLAGTYTAVADINMEFFQPDANNKMQRLGNGIANSPIVSSLATDQTTVVCSYVGGTQRYVKAVITGATTPSGSMALLAMQGHPRETVGFL